MIKRLVCVALIAFCGIAACAAPAEARHWRGGGGGGFYWGFGPTWGGYASPYYYGPSYYYVPNYAYPPPCGSRWIKVRRGGHWVTRRVVRCY